MISSIYAAYTSMRALLAIQEISRLVMLLILFISFSLLRSLQLQSFSEMAKFTIEKPLQGIFEITALRESVHRLLTLSLIMKMPLITNKMGSSVIQMDIPED